MPDETADYHAKTPLPQDPPEIHIDHVLYLWSIHEPASWFQYPHGPPHCWVFKTEYPELIEYAASGELDELWTRTARGTLALLLLLDQFPREPHNEVLEAIEAGERARDIAVRAVARGFDKLIATEDPDANRARLSYYRLFFYLPLCHVEDLTVQVAATALMENLVKECPKSAFEREFLERRLESFRRHRDVMLEFGRFPSRNEVLGRTSTPEELLFLAANPKGL